MDEKTCFIALTLVKGLGNVLIRRLVDDCGSAEKVFEAAKTAGALAQIDGIGAETENLVKNFSGWKNAEKEVSRAHELGFGILTLTDKDYPANLKEIHSAPPVLYVFGEIKERDSLSVAVVGSRYSSKYGTDTAQSLSRKLAEKGVCVVSGMARGIDSAAHKAAISADGRTVAVLGTGLDVIYPPENHELYKNIADNGAVVSAFALGTKPDKNNFPERNSVISGLSLGTVVVQAARKSGALITASLALEQNRKVFAVPGRIGENSSAGTNYLIKRGRAKLTESADDIAEEIPAMKSLRNTGGKDERKAITDKLAKLPEDRKNLLSLIRQQPLHIDEIAEKLGESVPSLSIVMFELEMEGLAEKIEGGFYQAKA